MGTVETYFSYFKATSKGFVPVWTSDLATQLGLDGSYLAGPGRPSLTAIREESVDGWVKDLLIVKFSGFGTITMR